MKKFLLTFLTFATFVGSVWGECSTSYGNKSTDGYAVVVDIDYAPSKITCTLPKKSARTWYIEESSDGKNYSTVFSETRFLFDGSKNVSRNLSENTRYIKFRTTVPLNDYNNIVIYKKPIVSVVQNVSSLESTEVGVAKTVNGVLTLDYANPSSDISISAYSNNGSVSLSQNTISSCTSGSANINLTYTPVELGASEITVKLSGGATGTYTFYGTGTFATPAGLKVTSTDYTSISLAWDAVSGADKYYVYVGSDFVGESNTNSFTLSGLAPASTFSNVTVKAVAVVGSSDLLSDSSNSISSVSTKSLPAPKNLSATATGKGGVTLTWSENLGDNEKAGGLASGYYVRVKKGDADYGEPIFVSRNALGRDYTYSVTDLDMGCIYSFKVTTVYTDSSSKKIENESAEVTYSRPGVAELVDETGNVIYGTLTEAVKRAGDGATINLLDDVTEDLVVSTKIEFNGNGNSIQNLYIKENGSVELTGNLTVVKDFGLEISATNSGQIFENGGQIEVTGKAYIDKHFDASGTGDVNKWYSLAVPFNVSAANGISMIVNEVETPATLGVDIAFFVYDSEKRAATISGKPNAWKSITGDTLEPGTFYLVGLGKSGPNIFRFYMSEGASLISSDKTINLYEYPSKNVLNAGWNGIGNSQLYHIGVSFNASGYAQILNSKGKFMTIDLSEDAFAVTTPMFIQTSENSTATLSYKSSGTLRGASASSATYKLLIGRENEDDYSDQLFVSASDDVTGEYTIGKDLAKFSISSEFPQIYTFAYDTPLSVHEAGYDEKGVAEMPLYLYAPVAGNYTLMLGKDVTDGTNLYLVQGGSEIHNFNNDGSYTLYLTKGVNKSYALRISVGGDEDIPTNVADNSASDVTVYVKEGVLVISGLAEGEAYMVGDMIRTLYRGESNGSDIRIPLVVGGVYWVKAGNTNVKILNK